MIRVARTPEGIVARVSEPYGETEAWRLSPSGHIARAIGHKGPWIATAAMPAEVRDAIARHEEERP